MMKTLFFFKVRDDVDCRQLYRQQSDFTSKHKFALLYLRSAEANVEYLRKEKSGEK